MKSEAWERAKREYPVGSSITGRVKAKYPFGVFLDVAGEPQLIVFLDIASYNPEGMNAPPTPLPEVGEVIEVVVAHYSERDKQVKVRVGRPFWEESSQ